MYAAAQPGTSCGSGAPAGLLGMADSEDVSASAGY